jgi:hypothetical protein
VYFFVGISEHWIFFYPAVLQRLSFLNIFFIPVEFFFFFFVVFVGGVLCLFYFMTLVSGSVYFGRVSLWSFSGGPGHNFFCVGLRCVECRSGTIYLSACLEWVAGLYRFSYSGLCCGEYGTIYLSTGQGWVAGLYRFSSGIICRPCVL